MQQIPLPFISKLTQNQTCVAAKYKIDQTQSGARNVNCCINAEEEENIVNTSSCDRICIEKNDQYCKVPLTTVVEEELIAEPSLKNPIIDRMLLRPGVINLPSLVTGASGKIRKLQMVNFLQLTCSDIGGSLK